MIAVYTISTISNKIVYFFSKLASILNGQIKLSECTTEEKLIYTGILSNSIMQEVAAVMKIQQGQEKTEVTTTVPQEPNVCVAPTGDECCGRPNNDDITSPTPPIYTPPNSNSNNNIVNDIGVGVALGAYGVYKTIQFLGVLSLAPATGGASLIWAFSPF